MMITIAEAISDLLYVRDTVVVPGLGAFVKKPVSAKVNPVANYFARPSSVIEFDANLREDNDLVINYLSEKNAIPMAEGIINLKNEKWKYDFSPVDPNGETFVDAQYTRAYLRHLFVAGEILGPMIASLHNIGFYLWLVRESRKHIIAGDFAEWRDVMLKKVTTRL